MPHLVEELDGQVTEPSGAQHRHSRTVGQSGPKNARVHRQAGREQRGRCGRVELRRESEGEPGIDNDVFGQAAVTVDGNDLLTGAELLGALPAEGAVETRLQLVPDTDTIAGVQVGDIGTGLFDDSNDLVSGDQRIPRVTPIIIDVLDVASREAAMRDPHEDVTAAEGPLVEEGLRRAAFFFDRVCSDLHGRLAVTSHARESNQTPSSLACAATISLSLSRARLVEAASSRRSSSRDTREPADPFERGGDIRTIVDGLVTSVNVTSPKPAASRICSVVAGSPRENGSGVPRAAAGTSASVNARWIDTDQSFRRWSCHTIIVSRPPDAWLVRCC